MVIKVRRKRKRQAANPPSPESKIQKYGSVSSSNLTESTEDNVLRRQMHVTQSASCLESDRSSFTNSLALNSITNSENSLNVSNDDVFLESNEPHYYGGRKYSDITCHRKRGYNDANPLALYGADKYRTHSASAVEDVRWTCNGQYETDNGSDIASSMYPDNSDAELGQYQSDTEILACERLYRQRKSSKSSEAFRQANNATPTSLWSFDGSEYEYTSCQSSPAFGKVCTHIYRVLLCLQLLLNHTSIFTHTYCLKY